MYHVYLCVDMYSWVHRGHKRASVALKLELQEVMSCLNMVSGMLTQVLCKSGICVPNHWDLSLSKVVLRICSVLQGVDNMASIWHIQILNYPVENKFIC